MRPLERASFVVLLGVFGQQITNFFIVNLEIGSAHEKLLIFCQADLVKDMLERVWNDASHIDWVRLAFHCERFTRSGLSSTKRPRMMITRKALALKIEITPQLVTCPYAKMVPLYPRKTASTTGDAQTL